MVLCHQLLCCVLCTQKSFPVCNLPTRCVAGKRLEGWFPCGDNIIVGSQDMDLISPAIRAQFIGQQEFRPDMVLFMVYIYDVNNRKFVGRQIKRLANLEMNWSAVLFADQHIFFLLVDCLIPCFILAANKANPFWVGEGFICHETCTNHSMEGENARKHSA